jgi:acyl carrier protein
MNNENFDKLKQFIVKERWEYDFPLTRETTIAGDLGIYGDDSDEFLIAFGKEFNVDVSQFRIGDYFSGEGDPILPAIIRLFTGKKKRQRKILTIGHLEKAVIAGRLDEEVINS